MGKFKKPLLGIKKEKEINFLNFLNLFLRVFHTTCVNNVMYVCYKYINNAIYRVKRKKSRFKWPYVLLF